MSRYEYFRGKRIKIEDEYFDPNKLDLELEHSLLSTESWLIHENRINDNLRLPGIRYIYWQKSDLQTKMKFMKTLDESEEEGYEDILLKARIKRIKWIREELKKNPNLSPEMIEELKDLQNYDTCFITGGLELYLKPNLVIGQKNKIPDLIDHYFIEYDKSIEKEREGQ